VLVLSRQGMHDDRLLDIAAILERPVTEAERASVARCEEMPPDKIADVLRIASRSRLYAVFYLRFLVPSLSLARAVAYLDQIEGAAKPG